MTWKNRLLILFVICSVSCYSCAKPLTPAEIAARKEEELKQENIEENIEFARVSGLVNVRKIFLGDFGNLEASDLVLEKVRARLSSSTHFEVVERPEVADAVMMGAAGVEKRFSQGKSSYAGLGVLRLKDIKTDKTIWNFEYQRGFVMPGESASSRVANQIVDHLLDDAETANRYVVRRSGRATRDSMQ